PAPLRGLLIVLSSEGGRDLICCAFRKLFCWKEDTFKTDKGSADARFSNRFRKKTEPLRGLKYNDIADSLAKEGTTTPQSHVEPSTYLELYSRRKALVNISWRHPPAHSWYRCEGPGAAIRFKGVRKDQTALARLSSGHLKTLRFSRGDKKFNICTKCNMIEATPQHPLDCVALVYDELLKRPDFVLEVMRVNDLIDLI
ncbi:hypothetical protein AVEN_194013-1, partial [Araneus ventricosus]